MEEGVTGLLVPPGEAGPLAQAIVRLARDLPRAAEMGEVLALCAEAGELTCGYFSAVHSGRLDPSGKRRRVRCSGSTDGRDEPSSISARAVMPLAVAIGGREPSAGAVNGDKV